MQETEKNQEDPIVKTKYCKRCGRKLKTTENRLRGMGPICWEKSHVESRRRLFDADGDA